MANSQKRLLNKKVLKTIWLVYALCSMAFVLYLLNHLMGSGIDNAAEKITLNQNWDIVINDDVYENVSLDSLRFKTVGKEDRIVMETMLPANFGDIKEPALCIPICQSVISVYVGEELIYEYGYDRERENKTVGKGLQLIDFQKEYQGEKLKIEMRVTENNAFSKFESLWLCDWRDSYRLIIEENRLSLFAGVFLVMFGIVVTILLIFAVTSEPRYIDLLLISIFSICMGVWTLAEGNIMGLFSIPPYTVSLIGNMPLLLAPLPILGYMYSYIKPLNSRIFKLVYRCLFLVQFLFSIGAIVVHSLDIVHSTELLVYLYYFFLLHMLFFLYVRYKNIQKTKKGRMPYHFGSVIVVGCMMYDVVAFLCNRYRCYKFLELKGVSSLGVIAAIAILLVDLFQDVTMKKMEEQEKELLIKRAYTDDLTQLHNRRFCSEYMEKLQEESGKYAILSLDINNLKQTNDAYGHASGDVLIKSAAKVISDVFDKAGVVGRMGGDEFIVILPTSERGKVDGLLSSLKKNIENVNLNLQDLNLSIAYGYATCDEIEKNSVERVYHLADNRMYQHKKSMKK